MGFLGNLITREVDKGVDPLTDKEWDKYASSKLPADVSPELAAELKGYVAEGVSVPKDRETAIRAEIGDDAYEGFEKVRGVDSWQTNSSRDSA